MGPPDLEDIEAGNFYYCALKHPHDLPGMQWPDTQAEATPKICAMQCLNHIWGYLVNTWAAWPGSVKPVTAL